MSVTLGRLLHVPFYLRDRQMLCILIAHLVVHHVLPGNIVEAQCFDQAKRLNPNLWVSLSDFRLQ